MLINAWIPYCHSLIEHIWLIVHIWLYYVTLSEWKTSKFTYICACLFFFCSWHASEYFLVMDFIRSDLTLGQLSPSMPLYPSCLFVYLSFVRIFRNYVWRQQRRSFVGVIGCQHYVLDVRDVSPHRIVTWAALSGIFFSWLSDQCFFFWSSFCLESSHLFVLLSSVLKLVCTSTSVLQLCWLIVIIVSLALRLFRSTAYWP